MKYTLILLFAFGLFATTADAQCRSFTKKNCMSSLDGYIQNDNYNSAILIPGDDAELMLTFLAGQDYRLIVCSHPVLGEVAYEINDASGKREEEAMASWSLEWRSNPSPLAGLRPR